MRRTTATTEYLKECMGTALLELMQEKPIEKISIEEMTARADVGRSTYFRYFKTKDEVLVFKIQQLWNRFAQDHNIQDFQANDDARTAIRLFFEFCLSIRQINDLLYRVGHQQVILDVYLQILRPEKQEEDVIVVYKSNETAYALYGVVNGLALRLALQRRGQNIAAADIIDVLLSLQPLTKPLPQIHTLPPINA